MSFGPTASAISLSSLSGDDLLFVALFGCFAIVCALLLVAYLVGLWRIFRKFGRPGWKSIVPVLSEWELGGMVGPKWLAGAYAVTSAAAIVSSLLDRLPVAVSIVLGLAVLVVRIAVYHLLARSFDRGAATTIGLVLVPYVFVPMLGLGEDEPVAFEAPEPDHEPDLESESGLTIESGFESDSAADEDSAWDPDATVVAEPLVERDFEPEDETGDEDAGVTAAEPETEPEDEPELEDDAVPDAEEPVEGDVPAAGLEPIEPEVVAVADPADQDMPPLGQEVTIKADEAPEGMVFDRWVVSGDATPADEFAEQTTLIVRGGDVQVEATYREADDVPVALPPTARHARRQ